MSEPNYTEKVLKDADDIDKFATRLVMFEDNLKHFKEDFSQKFEKLDKYPIQIPHNDYNVIFTGVNKLINVTSGAKRDIDIIANLMPKIKTLNDEVNDLCIRYRDKLNINKLKFGLEGQIKGMIDKERLPEDLNETVRNVITRRNDIKDVPAGGKRGRRSHHKRMTKRMTKRKHFSRRK